MFLMKVVVLGAGLMGKEVARDLIKNDKVDRVFLGDIDVKVAQDFVDTLNTDRVEVVELHQCIILFLQRARCESSY